MRTASAFVQDTTPTVFAAQRRQLMAYAVSEVLDRRLGDRIEDHEFGSIVDEIVYRVTDAVER